VAKLPKKAHKAVDFLISLAVYYILAVFAHEAFHYIACKALGGDGYITFPGIIAGYFYPTVLPPHSWIVGLAGGLGAGFLMLLLWWRARTTPTAWDLDEEFACALVGSTQIGYAIFEAFIFAKPHIYALWPAGVVCAAMGVTFAYFGKIARWMRR